MLKNWNAKWGLLVCGSILAGGGFGQCIGDVLENALVFRIVN